MPRPVTLQLVVVLAALAAPALGSPSKAVLERTLDVADKAATERLLDAPYTVQVFQSLSNLGPGALVTVHHVVCASAILRTYDADRLTVRAGTDLRFPINPLGQSLPVDDVRTFEGVAVLTLAKGAYAPNSPVAVGAVAPAPGSRATAVSSRPWHVQLRLENVWTVLPKYCAGESQLCASGDGSLLAVDGQLVGVGSGADGKDGVAPYIDVTPVAIRKFIDDASGLTTTPEPTPDPTTPATRPTEPPSTRKPTHKPTHKPTPHTTEQPPSGKTCRIDVKSLPKNAPVLVHGDKLEFREPGADGNIVVASGEKIRVACPGSANAFSSVRSTSDARATCVEDTSFLLAGKSIDITKLKCERLPGDTARRNGTCGERGRYTRIQIGFQLSGDDFVTLIDNCFDEETYNAVYSRMTLTPGIAGHQSGVKRPQFTPDDFYGSISPNGLYFRGSQQKAVGELLGDSALGTKYIPSSGDFFLARGHLSAKADYVLGSQQTATFHYVNAAPQWQTFNGVNWEKLESSVRSWVMSSKRTVQVVTGIWGTATLPNKDGVETELYLQVERKLLRVPKYYWKVVYDPVTLEGTAFVGLNNPYHVMTDEDVLCKDQCAKYSWLSWDLSSQQNGNGFCCDVNELRKTITTIPADLVVKGLLQGRSRAAPERAPGA